MRWVLVVLAQDGVRVGHVVTGACQGLFQDGGKLGLVADQVEAYAGTDAQGEQVVKAAG
ncbi:hypothetical protein [Streptomyces sp. NPDC096013]|uniref:hypothetical protein n=1 Tax=Streptomyces sp. NPDC096013 TaxID=3366069 RepID=UPI0037F7D39D